MVKNITVVVRNSISSIVFLLQHWACLLYVRKRRAETQEKKAAKKPKSSAIVGAGFVQSARWWGLVPCKLQSSYQ